MVRAAVPDTHPLIATTVVEMLDTVSGCILNALSVSPAESRAILAALWVSESTD